MSSTIKPSHHPRRTRVTASTLTLLIVLGGFASPALSDDGQTCTNAMLRSMGQVARLQALNMDNCATRAGKGDFPSVEDFARCLEDTAASASDNSEELTLRRVTRYCDPAPAVGFTDPYIVLGAGSAWELDMALDVFGVPLGGALLGDADAPEKAACQVAAIRGYAQLRDSGADSMVLAVRRFAMSPEPWTASGLAGAVAEGLQSSLHRVSKAEAEILARMLLECDSVGLAEAFPGRCGGETTVQNAASCIIARSRCRTCRMAETALGVAVDCESRDDGLINGSCPAETAACGNGTLEDGEACDSSDLAGNGCVDLGFVKGTLTCSPTCTMDTSACSSCGNGAVDPGEDCDGSGLADATCSSLGFQFGELACTAECRFDTAGCTVCGDGAVGGPEQCDGTNLSSRTCQSEGFDDGTLLCTNDCLLDQSGCFSCGDGSVNAGEECEAGDLGGRTCPDLGFVAGDLACSPDCHFDTSSCFETCNESLTPPVDFKFAPDDELVLVGDSVTFAFIGSRDHYGKLVRKILGSTYCGYAESFYVRAYGLRGSHYASYPRIIQQVLSGAPASVHSWIMFQDAGKSESLKDDRFQEAVRATATATNLAAPGAHVLFATTPPLEEQPERRGTCKIYRRQCNYTAHNDIMTRELGPETGAGVVPWSADFCRLIQQRTDLSSLQFTSDGIHPRAEGNLALAISLLKWAGMPREHLVLSGLEDMHPALTEAEANQVADWMYAPDTYDCSEVQEPCAEAEPTCAEYVRTMLP